MASLKSSSKIKDNKANPFIPNSYVSLSYANITDPSNDVKFFDPEWYEFLSDENSEGVPSFNKIQKVLDLSYSNLFLSIQNLEIELAYPLNYVGLPYYNNFEGKTPRQACGKCCYVGCNSNGYISSYDQQEMSNSVIMIKGLCYCDTTKRKMTADSYVLHRDACSADLLSLYTPYKDKHDNINKFVLNDGPIIQLLYLKKVMTYDRNFLNVLRAFRDQYFKGKRGIETGLLLQELNGRIKHSRICFDPSKKHCKMDWGHLSRILYYLNIVERIRIIVNIIDEMALNIILRTKKKTSSPKRSKGSSKGSKGSPKRSKGSSKGSKGSPKGSKCSSKGSKGSPKGSKGSSKGSKVLKKNKQISMIQIGSMKLGSKSVKK